VFELLSVVAFLFGLAAVLAVAAIAKKVDQGADTMVKLHVEGLRKTVLENQKAVKDAVNTLHKRLEKLEKDYQAVKAAQARSAGTLSSMEQQGRAPASSDAPAPSAASKTGTG